MRKALFFLALCSFCEHTLLAQCGPNGHLGPIGNGQKSCIYTVGSGTFVTLSGDASSTSTGGATVVNGLKGVPFCTGYTPTNGQFVEYTTGGSPNPCYTAAAGGGGGTTSDILRFGICITAGCGSETTINYIVPPASGTWAKCYFNLAVPPTGSSVVIDVEDEAGNSIFSTTDHCQTDTAGCLVITTSTAAPYIVTQTAFAVPGTYTDGHKYNATVAVGHNDSGGAAQGGTVQCR